MGTREQWGKQNPFGLSAADLHHHLYVIGMSGTGKTTLLRNLIVQDFEAGRGVGVLDPHGDLSEELLSLVPPHRIEKAVYLNPADSGHPVAFNPFQSGHSPQLVASGIVFSLKSIWRDSWGPRLEYILHAAVLALLECQNVSFLGIQRIFSDARYRAWVVRQVKDPIVHWFWSVEFENYSAKFAQEAVAPIQNKVGILLMSPTLRNILGQVQNRLEIDSIMDEGRIFIANLSKGRMGEDKSALLGALLISQFDVAAKARADRPTEERRGFRLYVDEFQSFVSDSIAGILSEARKYRLSLVLSHQYVSQVDEKIRDAVFGNVGSMVSFRVGYGDAELLEQQFGKNYAAREFTDLGNHEICARLLSNGKLSLPFMGRTLPPLGTPYGKRDSIVRHSRLKYSTPRQKVEKRIRGWLGTYPR